MESSRPQRFRFNQLMNKYLVFEITSYAFYQPKTKKFLCLASKTGTDFMKDLEFLIENQVSHNWLAVGFLEKEFFIRSVLIFDMDTRRHINRFPTQGDLDSRLFQSRDQHLYIVGGEYVTASEIDHNSKSISEMNMFSGEITK